MNILQYLHKTNIYFNTTKNHIPNISLKPFGCSLINSKYRSFIYVLTINFIFGQISIYSPSYIMSLTDWNNKYNQKVKEELPTKQEYLTCLDIMEKQYNQKIVYKQYDKEYDLRKVYEKE